MSRERPTRSPDERGGASAEAGGGPEGWESLAEDSEGSLAPNPELEEALREAAEAVEAAEARAGAAGPARGGEAGPTRGDEALVEELSARVVETEDRLLRLQADFENFRRRAAKERQEFLHYGHQNLVKDLLAAVDNLDRAIDHVNRGGGDDFESLLRGVELVRRDLLGALTKHGISEIEALGQPFDPALHEAMAQAPAGTTPANTVIEVLQKGYRLRDRLLRAARVVVASGVQGEAEASD